MNSRCTKWLVCIWVAPCLLWIAAAQQPQQPAPGAVPARGRGGRGPDGNTLLFNTHCAACHGATLEGGRAGSLLDNTWTYGGDDDSILRTIRDGRPEADMPSFKAVLTDQQQRGMLIFIRERAFAAAGRPATRATPMPDGIIKSERHAFKLETITEGLETPWAIAFLPDRRILVTERPGRLRIIDKGKLVPEPITGIPAVWSRQDGGLFDVALHPNYARNGWIYLSYAEPGENNTSNTVIMRGRIKGGAWVDQEVLYKGAADQYTASNIHYGSRFIFDKQGNLMYSIGDRGRQDSAQDLAQATGKVHRITEDGKVPRDNPFANRTGALGTIWSYGHRNPQGFAFHPVTGKLWSTEHGPRGGDEVNIIAPGNNYGWPVISYGLMTGGVPTETTVKEGMQQPVAHYTPSPGICPIIFYTGSRFKNWKNDALVGTMGHEELRRLIIKGDMIERQEVLFRGIGRVRDIVEGPDGYLYLALATPGASLAATTPGRIVRLIPVP